VFVFSFVCLLDGDVPFLSEGDVLCFMTRSVFLFFSSFLSFDATVEQQLDGFSPNLYQQMFLRCYSLMIVPDENRPPSKTGGPKRLLE